VPVKDVLGAMTGLQRSSDDVLALVAGCLSSGATPSGPAQSGPGGWTKVELAGGMRAFLLRDSGAWRIAAGEGDAGTDGAAWSVSYSGFSSGFPGVVTVRQEAPGGTAPTALTFHVSQLETNVPIDARAFDVQVPTDAEALTLEELRQSGPLADRRSRP
jgi:hypothetical protein